MNNLSIIIMTDRVDDRFQQALRSAEFAAEVIIVLSRGAKLNANHASHVKVVHMPGEITDFATARNQAVQFASQEWVLFLDSDEVLPVNTDQILRQNLNHTSLNGGYVYRRDIFYNQPLKWGEAGNMALLRVAKRTKLRFERPVHEVAQVSGPKKYLPLQLTHFAHQSIGDFWSAISRYSQLEAMYRYSKGTKFSWWQLILYPIAKFHLNYFFKLGFLDGWRGFMYAVMMSCHSLMVRVYLYEAAHR